MSPRTHRTRRNTAPAGFGEGSVFEAGSSRLSIFRSFPVSLLGLAYQLPDL